MWQDSPASTRKVGWFSRSAISRSFLQAADLLQNCINLYGAYRSKARACKDAIQISSVRQITNHSQNSSRQFRLLYALVADIALQDSIARYCHTGEVKDQDCRELIDQNVEMRHALKAQGWTPKVGTDSASTYLSMSGCLTGIVPSWIVVCVQHLHEICMCIQLPNIFYGTPHLVHVFKSSTNFCRFVDDMWLS